MDIKTIGDIMIYFEKIRDKQELHQRTVIGLLYLRKWIKTLEDRPKTINIIKTNMCIGDN